VANIAGFKCFVVGLGKEKVALFFTVGKNHSEMINYLQLNENQLVIRFI